MALSTAHGQHTYTIGIITALPIERAAVTAMLDERHKVPIGFIQSSQDPNAYTWGRIGEHHVVITTFAARVYGTTMATTTALPMLSSFPSIKFGLMVGIGAGVPGELDIRLGDVVVSQPTGASGGVFQFDLGKAHVDSWKRGDYLARPPEILLKALSHLRSEHELEPCRALEFLKDAAVRNKKWGQSYSFPEDCPDRLFLSSYDHEGEDCSSCDAGKEVERKARTSRDFEIHYGTIASGNSLVKSGRERERIAKLEKHCICIEMEAAGLMNNFPCLVVRGISDYADSHKNDKWQRYASATAAAFSKELLSYVPKSDVRAAEKAVDFIDNSSGEASRQSKHVGQTDHDDRTEKLLGKLLKGSYKEQKNRNSERIEGTCNWFTDHRLFKQWLYSNCFHLLWVSADPGCGKSVLARYLIDKVLPAPDRIVCYFFFKDEHIDQRTSTNALCALLHQLIIQERHDLDVSLLSDLTRSNSSDDSSFDELWQAYISIASSTRAQEIICILDALDECKGDDRRRLFHALGTLDTKKVPKLRLLMTGRPYDDLKRDIRILRRFLPTIHLAGEDEVEVEKISREIDIVTDYKVEKLGIEKDLRNTEVKFLQDKLKSIRNRTYLWVTLVIDFIRETPGFTRGNVHAVVGTLPKTVDDAYEKILSRSSDEIKARKLLSIILVATRPLHIEEAAIASIIAENHKSLDDLEEDLEPVARAENTIRHICGLFVTIVDSRLFLLHQTARVFLTHKKEEVNEPTVPERPNHKRRRLNAWKSTVCLSEAHSLLAQSCVWYLGLLREPFKKKTFYEYAAMNWMIHIREAQGICADSVIRLAAAFCSSTSSAPKAWSSIYCETDTFFQHRFHEATNRCTDLMVASYFGLVQVVSHLIDSESNLDAVDIDRLTPLAWAIRERHAQVMCLLMERGANLHLKDKIKRKALDWAISTIDVITIRSFLEKYIQNQLRDSRYCLQEVGNDEPLLYVGFVRDHRSLVHLLKHEPDLYALSHQLQIAWQCDPANNHALLLAAKNGNLELVQSLLKRSVDIDQVGKDGITALIQAIKHGQLDVALLLLDLGADAYLRDNDGCTALFHTAIKGYPNILKLLLDKGHEVDPFDKTICTPLMLASKHGQPEIVRLLMDRGADVNSCDKDGWTALIHATNSYNTEVARILSDRPVVVDLTNDEESSDSMVAKEKYLEIMQMLLDYGADINLRDAERWTALMHAVSGGSFDIVQMFLDYGADVNARDKHGWTALLNAVESNNLDIVRLLLNRDAAINLASDRGVTPLMHAAKFPFLRVMELLLDQGAEIDLTDEDGETALIQAARSGRLAVVQLFVERGADLNLFTRSSRTALMFASEKGHLDILELLLDRGADVNLRGTFNVTALMLAAKEGWSEVVELLLKRGAHINLYTSPKVTALMFAVNNNQLEVVKLLLEQHADPEFRDLAGETVLGWALKNNYQDIVEILKNTRLN